MKKTAVFLDRDDTIIKDTGFMKDPEKVKLLPNTVEGLKKIQSMGFQLIIICKFQHKILVLPHSEGCVVYFPPNLP